MRRSKSRPTTSSSGCGRWPARALSAPMSPSPTRAPRWPLPISSRRWRARSEPPTLLVFTGAGDPGREHRRRGSARALPAPPRGSSRARLGRRGRRSGGGLGAGREGAEVEVWNRTALRARHLCEELGGRPVNDPDQGDYELIVNTTAVGLGGEDPFEHLPLVPDAFSARPDRGRHGLRRSEPSRRC